MDVLLMSQQAAPCTPYSDFEWEQRVACMMELGRSWRVGASAGRHKVGTNPRQNVSPSRDLFMHAGPSGVHIHLNLYFFGKKEETEISTENPQTQRGIMQTLPCITAAVLTTSLTTWITAQVCFGSFSSDEGSMFTCFYWFIETI